MILQYFKKKENKDKANAEIIYLDIIYVVKTFINKKNLYIKRDLNSSFEITTFLLCCIFYGVKISNDGKSKKLTQELMDLFIKDLDHSFRISGVSDMKIGKTVKLYVKKFYFRLNKVESIFDKQRKDQLSEYIQSLDIFDSNNDKSELISELYNNSNNLINSIKKDHIIKFNMFNNTN